VSFKVLAYTFNVAGGFCPTTFQNKLSSIPVVPSQEEMDRVGFEPTTSAAFNLAPSISYLKGRDDNHT
jgi:hypothetical protein